MRKKKKKLKKERKKENNCSQDRQALSVELENDILWLVQFLSYIHENPYLKKETLWAAFSFLFIIDKTSLETRIAEINY